MFIIDELNKYIVAMTSGVIPRASPRAAGRAPSVSAGSTSADFGSQCSLTRLAIVAVWRALDKISAM